MSNFSVEEHVLYALLNAEKKTYPFPHFYVKNVFPADFYGHLIEQLEAKTDFKGAEGRYANRTFSTLEGLTGLEFIGSKRFLKAMLSIFRKEMEILYPDKQVRLFNDLRMVRDGLGYQIGPHTDAPWKLISLLFYLPKTSNHPQFGTSIYTPKDPAFRCPGGPHYKHENFHQVMTAPYVRNSAFCFFKTDNSFHGVEEVTATFNRDVLLYNIYDEGKYLQTHGEDKS